MAVRLKHADVMFYVTAGSVKLTVRPDAHNAALMIAVADRVRASRPEADTPLLLVT